MRRNNLTSRDHFVEHIFSKMRRGYIPIRNRKKKMSDKNEN